MRLFADYVDLAPVLFLLAGGVVILLLDMVVDSKKMARWGWWAALITALLAFGAACWLTNEPVRILNVVAYDAFTAYIWRLLLGTLVLVTLLSVSYIRSRTREPGLFYALLMFFGLGALLLAAASDIIMLLLTVDLLSIVGYVLTGFLYDDKRSTEAAIKYLIYGAAVSAVMALGLSWLYGLTGVTDYELTAQALSDLLRATSPVRPAIFFPILIFILAGFSFKIGSAPFHQWLPDAFEGAPVPVAASLAIVPKVAGFAALVRFTMVLLPAAPAMSSGSDLGSIWRWPLIGFLAVAAMVLGNLLGLGQANIKRLMAYSGIAQVGYALVAVAVASEASLSALLVYLTAYALAEIGAFAGITIVSEQAELDMVMDYRGLYRRSPLLAAVLIVCMFSLFGMPGTAGFVAKLWLFTAMYRAEQYALLVVAALNSVVSLAYYWKVIRAVFIHSDEGLPPVRIPAAASLVLVISLGGVLVLGVLPNPLLRWAQTAARVFFSVN